MSDQFDGREPGAPKGHEGHAETVGGQVPALVMRRISKFFEGNKALVDVDLTIHKGEVVALVGQNGSGKSTLVKVLSGYHEPEPGGELSIDGKDIPLPLLPGQAIDVGLSFVYQDLGLSPGMTVLENLNISSRVRSGLSAWFPIWWWREHREGAAVLRRYGVSLDLDVHARDLAPVDQARLAIVRSAHDLRSFQSSRGDRSSVLVLDEPTVFLPEDDVRFLFDLIRTIVGLGGSVLLISHDLAAIREIADRTVVLRDGHKIAEVLRDEFDEDELVNLIVGAQITPRSDTSGGPTASHDAKHPVTTGGLERAGRVPATAAAVGRSDNEIEIDRLSGGNLEELSLRVAVGEIVGFAGLIGSGAEDIPYLLFGSQAAKSGTLRIGGETLSIPHLTPSEAVRRHMALIPADRKQMGLGLELDVWENMAMLIQDDHFRHGLFHRDELVAIAEQGVGDFGIRPPWVHVRTNALSGGNQQKLLLAKWLLAQPRLLIAHEPTQGVDVGARHDIYDIVRRAADDDSMAVLWVSTDFTELEEVCDRVVVLSRGRQSGELRGAELTKDAISAAVLRQYEEVG